MASTTIADYQVLRDGGFVIDANYGGSPNTRTFNFDVPPDFLFASGSRKPMICFKVRPDQDSSFKIRMNHREIASFKLDQSHTRGYWETFNASQAFPEGAGFSDPTPVEFYISSGKIVVSDVVLWYQIKRNG
ncbi:MAG: hypothetical protein AAF702_39140 [Chloroflexota bacterium]